MGSRDRKKTARFDREGHEVRVIAEALRLERQQHEALATIERPKGTSFKIRCDEGAYLKGDDTAPPPLSYWASSIAF
jgi:hypothetical protein